MSGFLKDVYSKIAVNYERANHVFSFGLDILWRRRLARNVIEDGAREVLDVCTGTGETARYIRAFSNGLVKVTGIDFSKEMLALAIRNSPKDISYELADASSLPFPDGSFDAVTISFATRNLNSGDTPLLDCLREFCRVLKRGGVFYNLETSRPSNPMIRPFFRLYVKMLVVFVGRKFSGNTEGYRYLVSSILQFMGPEELSELIKRAGFSKVEFTRLLFGTVAIHKAVK